jgi:flagellin-specific chaperone FliS
MTKEIEIDIDLVPSEVVEWICEADQKEQAQFIKMLAYIHERKIGTFDIQLRHITDEIKINFDNEQKASIRNMMSDLYDYLHEELNET